MDGDRPGWTGSLILQLDNARGWSVGAAEVLLRPDTVLVRHHARDLAVLDRSRFRHWLAQVEPEPYVVDNVVWSVELGLTFITSGTARFRVAPESLRTLLAVI